MISTTSHQPLSSHGPHLWFFFFFWTLWTLPHLWFTKHIHANKYNYIKDKHICNICMRVFNHEHYFYKIVEHSMYRVLILKIWRLYMNVYMLHGTHRFSICTSMWIHALTWALGSFSSKLEWYELRNNCEYFICCHHDANTLDITKYNIWNIYSGGTYNS